MSQATLEEIHTYLQNAPNHWTSRQPKKYLSDLATIKRLAVGIDDQAAAKEVWTLEQLQEAQDRYIEGFKTIKAGAYYQGWCMLAEAENILFLTGPHLDNSKNDYHAGFILEHISRLQFLYPYAMFSSPEFLVEERRCSICNAPIKLRNHCPHKTGEVYNGELCVEVVTKVSLIGVSLVENPAMKCNVVFLQDKHGKQKDHYDYSLLEYVIDGLASPFHSWQYEETSLEIHHGEFKGLGRNDKCPCRTGKKYKHCCLGNDTIAVPHLEITCAVPPPSSKPSRLLIKR